MVRLAHAHVVDTKPFLPCREGPEDEAKVHYATSVGNKKW